MLIPRRERAVVPREWLETEGCWQRLGCIVYEPRRTLLSISNISQDIRLPEVITDSCLLSCRCDCRVKHVSVEP